LHIRRIGNVEKTFVKWFSPADHYPVVAEKESTHCRHQGDAKNKFLIEFY